MQLAFYCLASVQIRGGNYFDKRVVLRCYLGVMNERPYRMKLEMLKPNSAFELTGLFRIRDVPGSKLAPRPSRCQCLIVVQLRLDPSTELMSAASLRAPSVWRLRLRLGRPRNGGLILEWGA